MGRWWKKIARIGDLHAEYAAGASFSGLARKYGGSAATLPRLFKKRGLKVRAFKGPAKHDPKTGRWLPRAHASPSEIDAAVAKLKRVMIPPEIALEWRDWPRAKRVAFVRRLYRKFKRSIPPGRLSRNVERFDYTSENAWRIADRRNRGCNSREAPIKIKVASCGLIWHERLFFWSRKAGYQEGPFRRGHGRRLLHHLIWRQTHRRPVPAQHTVIFLDGNKNNFEPRNLGLRHRRDCAIENRMKSRVRMSRLATANLLDSFYNGANHEHPNTISILIKRRGAYGACA
ncbi:MAG TPA: HNH endonuclease [Verrucomicrobiae bacterium]|nr:HNH endonuclease [Verrucomicrobiae bacterium]